jgi:hypothetical protein
MEISDLLHGISTVCGTIYGLCGMSIFGLRKLGFSMDQYGWKLKLPYRF